VTFDARQSIDQGFQLLALRLEPIIADRLASVLGGLPWTTVLTELDRAAGRRAHEYATGDPQAQLKILTQRLGALGFPFDDHTRATSILGGELRIMRNRLAHNGQLDVLDAWRAHDFIVRLLERFDDEHGVAEAVSLRDEAFAALVGQRGTAVHARPVEPDGVPTRVSGPDFTVARRTGEQDPDEEPAFSLRSPLAPGPTLDFMGDGTPTPAQGGAGRSGAAFEPWTVVPIGEPAELDELPKKAVKEKVRAVAREVVEFEGPVHMDRVAALVAASFGLKRLHAGRAKKLSYQIRQAVVVDDDRFAWPDGVDRESWSDYRPSRDSSRRFTDISPVEIANAMRSLQQENPELTIAEIEVAVLELFGRKRRTSAHVAHLAKARSLLKESDDGLGDTGQGTVDA
jgi:DNA-directed RNA polymerase subunit K/omega